MRTNISNSRKRALTCAAVLASAILHGAGDDARRGALAADYTWDGGGGADTSWTSGVNWVGNVSPATGLGDTVFFGTGGSTANLAATSQTVGTIVFNRTASFTITATTGSLTIGSRISVTTNNSFTISAGVILGGNNVWDVANGTLTIAAPVSGAFSLEKAGGGLLVINAASTYSGATTISGGTLATGVLGNYNLASGIGSHASNDAANLLLNGGTLRWTGLAATSTDRNFTLGGGGGGLDASGAAGATISFNGTMTASGAGNRTFSLSGSNIGDNTLSSAIVDAGVGSVTSLLKSGAGKWVLSGASSYGGTTSISGGTLALSGGANRLPTGTAVTLSSGTAALDLGGNNQTIASLSGSGGTLALGAGNLTVGDANTTSFAGVITGSGGIIKQGSGTLVLSNVGNTYSGATVINEGAIEVNAIDDSGGSGIGNAGNALTLDGGTLRYVSTVAGLTSRAYTVGPAGGTIDSSSAAVGDPLTLSGAMTASGTGDRTLTLQGTNIGNNTLSGAIPNPVSGVTSILKKGSGRWIISGAAKTYTGTTTIEAGTLLLNASNIIPDGNLIIINSPTGGFELINQTETVGGITLHNGLLGGGTLLLSSGSFDVRAGTLAINLAGTAGLSKTTGGLVTSLSNSSYSGPTLISGGTLSVATLANSNALSGIGSVASNLNSNLVLDGGVLRHHGSSAASSNRNFTLGPGGGGFDSSGGGLSLSGTMSVPATSGSQTLSLSGSGVGTFAGLILDGASPNITHVHKLGTGTWILTAANTYTGTTTIGGGTLQIGGTSGAPGGGEIVNNANLVFNRTGTLTVTNVISGTGNVHQAGSGVTILSANNSYSGITTITGGVLEVSSSNSASGSGFLPLGTATDPTSLVLNAGTLRYNYTGMAGTGAAHDAGQVGRRFTLGTGGGTIEVSGNGPLNLYNNAPLTFSGSGSRTLTLSGSFADPAEGTNFYAALGAIIGNPTGGVTSIVKNGSGEWVLFGQNTYGGSTTINAGTLLLAHANVADNSTTTLLNVLPATTEVTLSGTGRLELYTGDDGPFIGGGPHVYEPLSQTIASLSGPSTSFVTLNGGTLIVNRVSGTATYSGTIDENADGGSTLYQIGGNFGKSGAGTLVLTGTNNSYTGVTFITGGTLSVQSLANGGVNSSIGAASSDASKLVLDGGTLRYAGAATSTDRLFNLGSGGGTLVSAGSGAMQWTNPGPIGFNAQVGPRTLTLRGTNTGNNTLAAVIGDGGGPTSLVKSDAGTWILLADNTYSGATTIVAGTLQFGAGGTNGSPGTGSISNDGNFVLNRSSTLSIGNLISGTGDLYHQGGGTLVLANPANSYTGATSISGGGVLEISKLSNVGLPSSIGAGTSGQSALVIGGTLRYTGSGDSTNRLFTLDGSNSIIDASGSGPISFTSVGALAPATGANRTLTLTGSNTGNNTLSASIPEVTGGDVSLVKTGAGKWVLNNASSTYAGTTTVVSGTLAMGGSSVLSPSGALIVDGPTAVLDMQMFIDTQTGVTVNNGGRITGISGAALTSTSAFDLRNGTVDVPLLGAVGLNKTTGGTVLLSSAASGYSGVTTISNGVLEVKKLSNFNALSSIGSVATNASTNLVLNGGTLKYTGAGDTTNRLFSVGTSGGTIDASAASGSVHFNNTSAMGFNAQSGARTLTLTGTSKANNTLSLVIGDNGGSTSLIKSGTGRWILTAANSYSGTTTVQQGSLLINGAHSGGGAVSVESGGVLGGTGSVAGNVTVQSGGKLAPGASIGTFSGAGDFTLAAGAIFDVEFGPTSGDSDLLQLTGAGKTLSVGGALLRLLPVNFSPPDQTNLSLTYTIAIATGAGGTVNSSPFANIVLIAGNQYSYSHDGVSATITFNSSSISVHVSAVPEPSGLMLMLAAGGTLLRRRPRLMRT
ncbi:beta strand repeat-containing protein [Fontivita pretiosa]|uniref:beta strand repeat-containing protein n=1 Tax=Fontivita pretiosa TaxID=2989684 RepID=UPI003D17C167